ncbi:lipopolysaccharide assembly protein LapA domain-containing protein [Trichothermofontia sp.]
MAPIFAVLIVASWVSAIAIVSVQNATPVTLQFLVWRSVPIPFGVVLAFSVTAGAVVMALVQGLWVWLGPPARGQSAFAPDDAIWDEDAVDDRP